MSEVLALFAFIGGVIWLVCQVTNKLFPYDEHDVARSLERTLTDFVHGANAAYYVGLQKP